MPTSEDEAGGGSPAVRGGRWGRRRIGLLALGCALVGLLGLRAALPWALARELESTATAALGRVVRVGDLDLGLLSGRAVARDLVVGPLFEGEQPPRSLDPEAAHFRAAGVHILWSWRALLRQEIHIRHAAVVSPRLVALRDAEGRLVPVLRPAQAPPEPEEAGEAWPLQLEALTIDDLELIFADREMPEHRPIEFRMARLELADLAVRGEEVRLGAVALSAPSLRVRRDLDLAALLSEGPEEEPAVAPVAEPEQPPPPLALRIEELSLEDAELALIGEDDGAEVRLALRARDVSLARDTRFPVELTLGLEDGLVSAQGLLGLAPPAFEGELSWEKLPLAGLARASGADLPLRLTSGSSSGSLRASALLPLDRPEAGPARVEVSGRVAVDRLEAALPAQGVELAWSGLELLLDELALRPARPGGPPEQPSVSFSTVRLREPVLRLTRTQPPDAEPTPAVEGVAPGAPPPDDAGAPIPVRIARLELEGGRVEFADDTVKPRHRSQLRELSLRAEGLRWPERDVGALSLEGRGGGESRVAVDAELRGGDGRVTLDLERLALPPFSPYTARGAGYWIEKGTASLRAQCGIRGPRYEIQGDLSLRRLGVSEVDPGSFAEEFGVPLDLALALLRDPKGRIGLPIASSVAGGEGGVDVGAIVRSVLRQALLGALATPLKGVGLVLRRGDAGEGAYFEPLPAAPGAGAVEIADARGFVEILEARPGIALRLHGSAGSKDQRALAAQVLLDTASAGGELPTVDAGFLQKRRLVSALEARARGEATGLEEEDAARLESWLDGVEVPADRRRGLARQRAESVREVLVRDHGVDPGRVEIGKSFEGEPGVRVELTPLRGGAG